MFNIRRTLRGTLAISFKGHEACTDTFNICRPGNRRSPEMKRISVTATIAFVWLIVALGLDRLVLSRYCLECANILALEVKVKLPAAEITYPPVSLLVLVVFPMCLLAIALIPWRRLHSGSAWKEAVERWCQPWSWLLFAIILCILGETLFIVTKDFLPKAISELAEQFTITGTISVAVTGYKETTPLALTASLSGLIGLTIGAYFFLKKGVGGIFGK